MEVCYLARERILMRRAYLGGVALRRRWLRVHVGVEGGELGQERVEGLLHARIRVRGRVRVRVGVR